MKKYNYKGYVAPIEVSDNGVITYRGYIIEKYFHEYKGGSMNGFSYITCAKTYYRNEMDKIDDRIEQKEYREMHKKDFDNLSTASEDLDYFFEMMEG